MLHQPKKLAVIAFVSPACPDRPQLEQVAGSQNGVYAHPSTIASQVDSSVDPDRRLKVLILKIKMSPLVVLENLAVDPLDTAVALDFLAERSFRIQGIVLRSSDPGKRMNNAASLAEFESRIPAIKPLFTDHEYPLWEFDVASIRPAEFEKRAIRFIETGIPPIFRPRATMKLAGKVAPPLPVPVHS